MSAVPAPRQSRSESDRWSGRMTAAPYIAGRTVRSDDDCTACYGADGPVVLRRRRMSPGKWSGRTTTAPRATEQTARSHYDGRARHRPDGPVTLRHHRMLRGRLAGRTATRPMPWSRRFCWTTTASRAERRMFLSHHDSTACRGQSGPAVVPRHGVCPKGDKVGDRRPDSLAAAPAGSHRDLTGSPRPPTGSMAYTRPSRPTPAGPPQRRRRSTDGSTRR